MSTSRPRVLMLTTQLGYGGAETSFIRLANFLAESMDVTVALFTATYGTSNYSSSHEPLHTQVTLLDTPGMGRFGRWWERRQKLRALKKNHDVCISFLSGPNLVNVLAGYNARTVVSLRGSRFFDPVAPRLHRLLFQYMFDPLIFRLAARIVPVSPGLIHEICWVAGRRTAAKSCVIPPFINCAALSDCHNTPPPIAYESLKGQPVIVAAGRLSQEKGIQHLLPILAEVAHDVPGVKLLLIGDGPLRETLQTQCRSLQLAIDDLTPGTSAVIFAGYHRDVLPLMQLGQFFILPSATEGSPNTILEAMAAGLPVLAADTPWGARAILSPENANIPDPYPTTRARPTPYGILMPRIDAPEYTSEWKNTLLVQLRNPSTFSSSRMEEFDVATVGNQWKQLIHDLLRH